MVIIIVLMCLGLLALQEAARQPDPGRRAAGDRRSTMPYPGASPETVEREIINRIEKSLQSIPQVYEIRSTASERQRADRHHLQLQEEHGRRRPTRSATPSRSVRHKLPIEMREPVL